MKKQLTALRAPLFLLEAIDAQARAWDLSRTSTMILLLAQRLVDLGRLREEQVRAPDGRRREEREASAPPPEHFCVPSNDPPK
jgi:hypothetical protein